MDTKVELNEKVTVNGLIAFLTEVKKYGVHGDQEIMLDGHLVTHAKAIEGVVYLLVDDA